MFHARDTDLESSEEIPRREAILRILGQHFTIAYDNFMLLFMKTFATVYLLLSQTQQTYGNISFILPLPFSLNILNCQLGVREAQTSLFSSRRMSSLRRYQARIVFLCTNRSIR